MLLSEFYTQMSSIVGEGSAQDANIKIAFRQALQKLERLYNFRYMKREKTVSYSGSETPQEFFVDGSLKSIISVEMRDPGGWEGVKECVLVDDPHVRLDNAYFDGKIPLQKLPSGNLKPLVKLTDDADFHIVYYKFTELPRLPRKVRVLEFPDPTAVAYTAETTIGFTPFGYNGQGALILGRKAGGGNKQCGAVFARVKFTLSGQIVVPVFVPANMLQNLNTAADHATKPQFEIEFASGVGLVDYSRYYPALGTLKPGWNLLQFDLAAQSGSGGAGANLSEIERIRLFFAASDFAMELSNLLVGTVETVDAASADNIELPLLSFAEDLLTAETALALAPISRDAELKSFYSDIRAESIKGLTQTGFILSYDD